MRMIDADKLKEELSYKSSATDFDIDSVILRVIDEQPTIDAVPVVHGEWEQVEVIDYDGISMNDDAARCTVCGHVEQSVYWARTYYHYCPNCGANMEVSI